MHAVGSKVLNLFIYLFIFWIWNDTYTYIDNNKVQGKNKRSFPQNIKPETKVLITNVNFHFKTKQPYFGKYMRSSRPRQPSSDHQNFTRSIYIKISCTIYLQLFLQRFWLLSTSNIIMVRVNSNYNQIRIAKRS